MFLGLDKLHNLTTGTTTRYEVRADLQTFNESAYAVYDFFQVASSKERYKLSVGKYRGTAGKRDVSLWQSPCYHHLRIDLPCAMDVGCGILVCRGWVSSLTMLSEGA